MNTDSEVVLINSIWEKHGSIICCPACKSDLHNRDRKLVCARCRSEYKSYDGIFRMLPDKLDCKVSPADWDEYKWECLEKERARDRMRKILKYIPRNGVHLDVGTGRGEGTREVSKIKATIGIDYGVKSLSIAKQYGLMLLQADGRHLPFKSSVFASITAMDVAEHIPEPRLFLNEVYRVLVDDGVFILQTPVTETEAMKTAAKIFYERFRIVQVIDSVANRLRRKIRNINNTSGVVLRPQPYDVNLSNRLLLNLFHDTGFDIAARRKVNYFVDSCFIQMFSYSDLFILRKQAQYA